MHREGGFLGFDRLSIFDSAVIARLDRAIQYSRNASA
jgi:hypothetical protein